jgi:hypothetical protein
LLAFAFFLWFLLLFEVFLILCSILPGRKNSTEMHNIYLEQILSFKKNHMPKQNLTGAGHQCLMAVILATQKAKMRRIKA